MTVVSLSLSLPRLCALLLTQIHGELKSIKAGACVRGKDLMETAKCIFHAVGVPHVYLQDMSRVRTHALLDTDMRTQRHACTHAHTHRGTHAHTRTHTEPRMHTRAHTQRPQFLSVAFVRPLVRGSLQSCKPISVPATGIQTPGPPVMSL